MQKKSSTKKKTSPKTSRPAKSNPPVRRPSLSASYDEEYSEYLERYEMYGEDRPRLSPSEFNRLDDELLDLLGEAEEGRLSDDQMIRLHELEYLLLDEQSSASF